MQASPVIEVDKSVVLGKATARAAEKLGLTGRDLAQTIGLSEPTISRIVNERKGIDPQAKEGQLALLVVRVFRSLDALVGGDDVKRRLWMSTHNKAFHGVPHELIKAPEGLSRVLAYLDGMRAPS